MTSTRNEGTATLTAPEPPEPGVWPSSLYVDRRTGVIECSEGPHAVGVYRSVTDGEWRAICATCNMPSTEGTLLEALPTLDAPDAADNFDGPD